jgi:hypothetical protein
MRSTIAEGYHRLHDSRGVVFVRRNAGMFMVLAALVAGIVYYSQVKYERDFIKCQTDYNTALATQLITRSKLFQEADNNRDALLRGVGVLVLSPAPKDEAEQKRRGIVYKQLFTAYQDSANRLDNERANTQLPPIPDCP